MCLKIPELPARDSTVKTSRLFEWPHSIPTFGSCAIQPRMGHDHLDWKLLQTNAEMLPRLGHDSVLRNHFQPNIQRSSHHEYISIQRYWQRTRTQKKKGTNMVATFTFQLRAKNNAIQLRAAINIAISLCLLDRAELWQLKIKDQLDVTCYFISLLMCSTCFGY